MPIDRLLVVIRRILPKAVFALIPAALLLAGLTFLFSTLERKKIILTERPDDRVVYLESHWFRKEFIEDRWQYVIDAPAMIHSIFPVEKKKDTFRIIMTGGSFIMGTPYVMQYRGSTGVGGIPDWLSAELTMMYSSRNIEMINAAAGAQNSDRVALIVSGLVHAGPDLMIVATGNNEGFVRASGLNQTLHEWVVYRMMKRTLLDDPKPEERPYFTPQDPKTEKIERNFRVNIERIVEACRNSGTRLMLMTLPVNLKYDGPYPNSFGSAGAPGDDNDLREGSVLVDQGKYEAALEKLRQSPNPAWAAFHAARALEKMERFGEARDLYKFHAQLVPKNRTRPSYNEFVRKVARDNGLLLVDLEKFAEDISDHGIADPKLFVDYCHMTREGYYRMAREVLRVIVESEIIPGDTGEPLPEPAKKEVQAKNPMLLDSARFPMMNFRPCTCAESWSVIARWMGSK